MAQLKSTIVQGALTVTGNVVANKLIKTGGTASQILMADGSTLDKASAGTGTVTSVGISSSNLTISGSPITSNGTITINHPTTTATTAGAYLVGKDALGHVVLGNKLTPTDLGLSNVYQYKGTVANYASLPTSGLAVGHVYNVTDTGMNYAWTGSAWDALGWIVDLSPYLTAESDTLQTVTNRGTTTNKAITTAGLTTTGTVYITGTTGHREGIRIAPVGNLSSIWWNATGTQDYTTGQMWGITAYDKNYTSDATKTNTFRFRGPTSATATSATDQMWINTAGLVTSRGGFAKSGSSDSYVLLAGGGTKALSDFQGSGNYVTIDGAQTITGIKTFSTYLKTAENTMGINLRTHTNYETGWVYGTAGNEAVTLAMQNPVTAFQIVYGTKPSAFSSDTWQTVTPLFQTKDGKVIINRKIAQTSDTTSLKLLDVNGEMAATTVYENGTSLANKYAAKSHNHDGTYLKAEADTLQSVTDRGATTTKTITALSYNVNSKSTIQYNTTEGCLEFVFA